MHVGTLLVPHAAKSLLRTASTTFTAGLANPMLSLAEDLATVVLFVLALLVPLLVAAAVVMAGVVILRTLRARSRTAVRVS